MIDEELYDFSGISGVCNPEIEEILVAFDALNPTETAYELSERLDKDSLKDLRGKIFDIAKRKVVKKIGDKGTANLLDDASIFVSLNQPQLAEQCVNQWLPLNRRAKHKLASDTIEFLHYAVDHSALFPSKLIRGDSLDKFCLEECSSDNLFFQLNRDLERAEGDVEVDLVFSDGNRERHTITFECSEDSGLSASDDPRNTTCVPPAQAVDILHPCVDVPTTQGDANPAVVSDKPVLIDCVPVGATCDKLTPVSSSDVVESGEYESEPISVTPTLPVRHVVTADIVQPSEKLNELADPVPDDLLLCHACGALVACANVSTKPHTQVSNVPKVVTRTISTSTADFDNYLKMENYICVAGDGEKLVSQTELGYHTDYIEGLVHANTAKVAELGVWRCGIDDRVARIEADHKKRDAAISAQQKLICDKLGVLQLRDDECGDGPSLPRPALKGQTQAIGGRAMASGRSQPMADKQTCESIWDVEVVAGEEKSSDGVCTAPVDARSQRRPRGKPRDPDLGMADPEPRQNKMSRAGRRRTSTADADGMSKPPVQSVPLKPQRELVGAAAFLKTNIDGTRPKNTARHGGRGRGQKADARLDNPVASNPFTSAVRGRGPSGPPGLRKSSAEQVRAQPEKSGKQATAMDEPRRETRGGLRSAKEVDVRRNAPPVAVDIDITGMSTSWYEEDNDNDNEDANRSSISPIQVSSGADHYVYGGVAGGGAVGGAPNGGAGYGTTPIVLDAAVSSSREDSPPSDAVVIDEGEEDVSYSRVVTRSGWKVVPSKKRKRDRSGNKKLPALRGVKTAVKRELYVQGLDYSLCTCFADLEDIVFAYCLNRGVTALDCCTIPKAKSRVEAGCKVTIREIDCATVAHPDFWPENITVRPWVPKARGNKRGDAGDASE